MPDIRINWHFGGKGSGKVHVKGTSRWKSEVQKFGEDYLAQAKEAVFEELNRVLQETLEITPIDTGRLRESGRVFRPKSSKREMRVSFNVMFGGVKIRGREVDYAAAVHEATDVNFKRGQAKYLETTWARLGPGFAQRVANRIKLPREI